MVGYREVQGKMKAKEDTQTSMKKRESRATSVRA
jgi:hypothetical protein